MKRIISLIFSFTIIFTSFSHTYAITDVDEIVTDTALYLYETVSNPQIGSVGGEWAVIGLKRSEIEISREYFENYYWNVENYVKECGGVLHDKKYTEYSRVILALTAIGKNPADVAGYNLITPLLDYEKTVWQGINGPVWALIALDSGNYEAADIREKYINYILENQLPDGGWTLSGDASDPDITGMVLQALSKYQDNEKVKTATEKALLCMSEMQNGEGGFLSLGNENSESCVQMIVALTELGISLDDPRFVKNGNTLVDNLMTYYVENKGFKHTYNERESNLMATEQGFYALVSVKRFLENKNSLYRMDDALKVSDDNIIGLFGKNPDVKKMEIIFPGKTFSDIIGHDNQTKIEALSERNIINGKTDSAFEPYSTMTRAEFAAIIVKGLGLSLKESGIFSDISENDWFFGYVNTAYSYGIVNGVSEKEFNPYGTITREEAAVMIERSAKLCGMKTDMGISEARNILAGFSDYVKASDWAVNSLAFCYGEKILPDDAMEIKPHEAVTRAEIASMLYNMLENVNLL